MLRDAPLILPPREAGVEADQRATGPDQPGR